MEQIAPCWATHFYCFSRESSIERRPNLLSVGTIGFTLVARCLRKCRGGFAMGIGILAAEMTRHLQLLVSILNISTALISHSG
jgi:hypothetical protein